MENHKNDTWPSASAPVKARSSWKATTWLSGGGGRNGQDALNVDDPLDSSLEAEWL
jgi:hypothetical protein